jgi:hypothetical protein
MKTVVYSWFFGIALILASAAPASGAVTENIKIPWSQEVFVPCAAGGNGEVVVIGGTLHILSNMTVDNSGGVHMKFHFQPQGTLGLGLTTGNIYRGGGVTQGHTNISTDGLPFIDTFVNSFNVIGTAGAESFKIHNTVHVTVSANGDISAEVDNSSTTCM